MRIAVAATFCLPFILTGCSLTPTAAPAPDTGPAITGQVHGGQQAISGAQVYLFAANAGVFTPNTNGYGNASLSLLKSTGSNVTLDNTVADATYGDYYVTTDANGNFSITGDYTCAAGQQVYLYALGGNPGLGSGTNSASGLLAILGNCPGTTFSSSLYVRVNEVSTVAAAYAFSGFATDAVHVSSSGTALAKTGIANAFANATNLADLATGAALQTPPGTLGSAPYKTVNTIADILAACVNSSGPASTGCTTLFGNLGTSGATDTATAAIYLALTPYPGATQMTNLYGNPTPTTPFTPTLTAQPASFTIVLSFAGAGLTATNNQPHGLAIDASGNVWIASAKGSVLSEFTPLGVPSAPYGSIGLNNPQSVALDVTSTHIWIANYGSSGSITKFTISGATAANYTTSISGPYDVAIDGSGNAWVPNFNLSSITKLSSTGGVLFTSSASANGLNGPEDLAIEPGTAGNVWVADNYSGHASAFTNAGATFADDNTGGIADPFGIAIDAGGNVWFTNEGNNSVSKLASSGTSGSNFTLGTTNALLDAIAIDGAGNAWITDNASGSNDNTVFELNNSGTNLSGSTGYLPGSANYPDALAVDGSGNVWFTSQNTGTVYELVGAAVPVVTPIAYAVANTLLGTRP